MESYRKYGAVVRSYLSARFAPSFNSVNNVFVRSRSVLCSMDASAMERPWAVPAFRTGGGFSLTQRSPRPRATHDCLPPPASMQAPPKFLKELLLRADGPGSPKVLPRSVLGQVKGNPASSPRSLELQVPVSARQRRFHTPDLACAALSQSPHSVHAGAVPPRAASPRATSPRAASPRGASFEAESARGQQAGAVARGLPVVEVSRRQQISAPLMTQGSLAGGVGRSSSPVVDGVAAYGGDGFGSEEAGLRGGEPKRGLTGCTPRHQSSQSHKASSPLTNERDASGGTQSGAGRGSLALGAGCAGVQSAAAGESGAVVSVSAGVLGGAGGAISCVPFPSMRHANHLASVARPSAGPRYPPKAPTSRDESAVSRVSNYSIKPCIHDALLSQRFGAKASSRALATSAPAGGTATSVTEGAPPSVGSQPPHPTSAGSNGSFLGSGILGGASVLASRDEVVSATARKVPRVSSQGLPPTSSREMLPPLAGAGTGEPADGDAVEVGAE